MWSALSARPLDFLSARRITLFFSAILIALLTTITVGTVSTQAQLVDDSGRPKAVWSGDNIEFEGQTYGQLDSPPDLSGTVCEDRDIIYAHHVREDNEPDGPVIEARIICFRDEDRSKDIEANVLTLPDATSEGGNNTVDYGDRVENETSTYIAAEGTSSTTGETDTPTTNCSSEYTHGIGWLICPVARWLAAGMDMLYNILKDFLVVSPILTDRDKPLYYMWDLVRNIANILFIVGFLIIIYSHTTSIGLSSYGIKRLLPRLIIAAVLVNISYWISAVAVDVSNILGVSIKEGLDLARAKAIEGAPLDLGQVSFENATGAVLTGATALALVGGGILGLAASAGGSIFFLLPILVGAIISALVAILILAARQALITVLVIISPLAFVAYLLPSTEKYFDRWRGLFTTMLLVYPAFSLIFGGAQLAGMAIISTADPDSDNYFNIILLGMAVQIAPIIITPLLIRLSGSLLGRIAGIVNDPNKGLIDKTKQFAQTRHDMHKNRQLWDRDENGNLKHYNPLAWSGRKIALREKHRAHQLKAWESGGEATYKGDHRYHEAHVQEELNARNAAIGEQSAKRDFERELARNDELRRLDIQSRVRQDQASLEADRNATYYEALKAKPGIANAAIRDLAGEAQEVSSDKKSEQYRKDAVTRVQDDNYHGTLANNEGMQRVAGYQEVDEFGPLRVRAATLAKIAAASGDRIKNYSISYSVDNIAEADILELALGRSAAGIEINEEAQEAAIKHIVESGHVEPMITLNRELNLTATGSTTIRKAFAEAMKSSNMKPKFVPTSQLNDAVPQGLDPADLTNYNDALVHKWIVGAVRNHKYDVGGLSRTDPDDINFVRQVFNDRTNGVFSQLSTLRNENGEYVLDVMRRDIRDIFKDPRIYADLGNRADPLRLLAREIGGLSDDDLRPDPRR